MGTLMDRKVNVPALLLQWYVFLSTTLFTPCLPIPNVTCRKREREALLTFKQHIKDPSNLLSSWTSKECCVWQGINCDNMTGHVVQLNLEYMGLEGFLNDSLKELNHLRSLDLSWNSFEDDHVPKFLGSFQNLEYLSIGGSNMMVDNLQWLSNLSLLKSLDMSGVNLSSVHNLFQVLNMFPLSKLLLSSCQLHINYDPTLYINFSSLTMLDLSWNHISYPILNWLSNLTSLVTLDLSGSFIPVSNHVAFHTSTLRNLHLEANNFSMIPNWLYNITNLEKLYLSSNHIQHLLPNDINYISQLTDLDFSNNQLCLSNTLSHVALHNISNLKNVNLHINNVSTIPYWLQNATNLQRLDLSNNLFEHILPSDFGSFSHLVSLDLSYNNLQGDLSVLLGNSSVSKVKNLESLDLSYNSLFGSIPMSIGTLSSLKVLNIGSNHLNGTIATSFGDLLNLEGLYMNGNDLEGSISEFHFSSLTRLKVFTAPSNRLNLNVRFDWVPPFQLEVLDLSSWQVGPQFPTWIQSQKDLKYLGLSNSKISDVIPSWFWSGYSQLSVLDLSHNQIHGQLPPHFLSTLHNLDLSNNSFHGFFPPMFCEQKDNMYELNFLYLSRNLLSGELPDCWMNYPMLQVFELGNNNLTGNIPSSLCFASELQVLSLYKNNLFGNLPLSLQNCTSLQLLDLSENNFSGDLPIWLGNNSQKLEMIVLRSNKFMGSIPKELCHIDSLQILDLAHNKISGNIPHCFGNLSGMTSFSTLPFYDTVKAYLVTKGKVYEYGGELLGLVRSMDLSSNNLTGEIPRELFNLSLLRYLNLSNNKLHGRILYNINDMKQLETLDVSMNQLTGVIPQSLASLTFLNYVNFSYNEFFGKIPTSTQFQSFSGLSFIGNHDLCGPPLTTKCPGDDKFEKPVPNANDKGNKDIVWIEMKWFYIGMPFGFIVGFWGVLGPLMFNKSWNYAYYKFWDDVKHRIFGGV